MNLFVLDLDPFSAAEQNCDKHVCKIILEAADCLATAHWITGGMPAGAPSVLTTYRQTTTKSGKTKMILPYYPQSHINNHVTMWVRAGLGNYRWTVRHGLALCREYQIRYGKLHRTEPVLRWLRNHEPDIPTGSTPFRQAVARDPIDCVRDDVVLAYKLYYVYYKSHFAKWKRGNPPSWFTNMMYGVELGLSVDDVEEMAA